MKIGIGIKVPSLSNLPGSSRPGSGSGGGGGVIPPSGEIFKFDTTTIARSSKELACAAAIEGFFFTTAGPVPDVIFPEKGSRIYIDAEATGYPEPGWYSQNIPEFNNLRIYYVIGSDGLVTEDPDVCSA
jgi:hypothetical protein